MATLQIKRFKQEIYIPNQGFFITWQAVEYYGQPNNYIIIEINPVENPVSSPFPQFANVEDAYTYFDDTQATLLVNLLNTNLGYTNWTDYNISEIDPPVSAMFSMLDDVAFTGSYSSLEDLPTIPVLPINQSDVTGLTGALTGKSDTSHTHAYSSLTSLPSLFSGSYIDLTNKPTIPSAQVQADYTQSSSGSIDFIKNKPSKQSSHPDATGGATNNLATNYNLVSGILGVANGLNDANTAQNDMANKLNSLVTSYNGLLAKLRTYGVIAT